MSCELVRSGMACYSRVHCVKTKSAQQEKLGMCMDCADHALFDHRGRIGCPAVVGAAVKLVRNGRWENGPLRVCERGFDR
jgi:hypothetical protein